MTKILKRNILGVVSGWVQEFIEDFHQQGPQSFCQPSKSKSMLYMTPSINNSIDHTLFIEN